MALLAGFEPTTFRVETDGSVQLSYRSIFTKHDLWMDANFDEFAISKIALAKDRQSGFWSHRSVCIHSKVIFNFQTTSEVYYDMLDMSRAIFIGIVELLCYERCSLTAVCFYHLRLNPRQTSKLLRLTQLANLLRYRPVRWECIILRSQDFSTTTLLYQL